MRRLYSSLVRCRFFLFCPIFILAGCISIAPGATGPFFGVNGTSNQLGIPPLPFIGPNLLGVPQHRARALNSIEGALACLETGNAVFAMTVQNSNVRAAPETSGCRMGRTPKGRLIRVNGIYAAGESTPLTELRAPTEEAEEFIFGFEEDIEPIFSKNCSTCHGKVIKTVGLQVTEYDALMEGSLKGPVIVVGDAAESILWQQIETDAMPLIGALSDEDKAIIKAWINSGALKSRPSLPKDDDLWLLLNREDVDLAPNSCDEEIADPQTLVSSDLVQFLSCGIAPPTDFVTELSESIVGRASSGGSSRAASGSASTPAYAGGSGGGIQVAALGLAPPSDSDPFFIPQGGFCMEQHQARRLQDQKSITAISFAPDGRIFLALDAMPTGQNVDPLVLLDAYHPSRSVAVFNSYDDGGYTELLTESSRITGLDYHNGSLYISRAGEVGHIPDGGSYQKLAAGFAVNSQLWHANNGIVVADGWLYISAGGVRDGWSDGPIEGIGEDAALSVISGGNRLAARIVRAPLEALRSQRSINLFETVARGFRNPYGLAGAPDGRLWITDNGATNVPEGLRAGDEINVLNPRAVATGTADSATPFYGFPLALTGSSSSWVPPVINMPNSAAPTGITWAYGTVFYAQYGRDAGLYRLGRAGGQTIAERIMMGWPIISVATAPDGALWIGTGTGGLYRLTPGCG